MVNAYLAADSDSEQRALSQCLQRIQALRDQDVAGRKVGYRIACESLRKALESLTGSRGHYLADGVVVSPLLEMRALPFRVVFSAGWAKGGFRPPTSGPARPDPRQPAGGRRQSSRARQVSVPGNRSLRTRPAVPVVCRADSQTGDELEPSPVIHELIRHLHRGRHGQTRGGLGQ